MTSSCNLLEPAASGWPDLHPFDDGQCDINETKVEVDPEHKKVEIGVEAHRRWRTRNKHLIDNPPKPEAEWKQDLKRKAQEQSELKAQGLWSATPRLVKKKRVTRP